MLALFVFVPQVDAAVVTWNGDGATNNWSDGDNWDTDSAPGSSDVATFDGTSTKASTIDASWGGSVQGIDINTGYTNTITQARSVTVGASHYDQADGTFTGSADAFHMNGSFTLSSGTFTASSGNTNLAGAFTHTAGGTFNHNDGTFIPDGNTATYDFDTSDTFYAVNLNKNNTQAVTVASGDIMIVAGDLTLTDGRFNTGSVEMRANVTVGSSFDGGTSPFLFQNSTAEQTFDLSARTDGFDGDMTIDKASGSVVLASNITMNASGQVFTITSGSKCSLSL